MATYKAEFLSHYCERKLRPLAAYAVRADVSGGPARRSSRRAWRISRRRLRRCSRLPKARRHCAAAARCRCSRTDVPSMVPRTASRAQAPSKRVMLWPDTFNNHFHPAGRASGGRGAGSHAGYRGDDPAETLCCGRPLYDYGMLDQAKTLLRENVDELRRRSVRASRRRPGAELRLRLPRRDAEHVAATMATRSRLSKQCNTARRVFQQKAKDVELPPKLRRQGAGPGTLPSQIGLRHLDDESKC